MILDQSTMIADDLAHDGTPTVLDLETTKPGPGGIVKMFIQGSTTLAGCTGYVITDGATSAAADAHATVTATLAGTLIEFALPSDIARYVKVDLVGTTTAGTWNCGLVMPGNQTNL